MAMTGRATVYRVRTFLLVLLLVIIIEQAHRCVLAYQRGTQRKGIGNLLVSFIEHLIDYDYDYDDEHEHEQERGRLRNGMNTFLLRERLPGRKARFTRHPILFEVGGCKR